MQKTYRSHSACFDRELFRKQVIALDENGIDYKVINKENRAHARAPLSGFFESEIHFYYRDFERADQLLKEVIEKYS